MDDAVWAAKNDTQAVVAIDPATNEVVATIDVGIVPYALAAGAGMPWVINYRTSTVTRIDPYTN